MAAFLTFLWLWQSIMTKRNLGRKGLLSCHNSLILFHHKGKSGRSSSRSHGEMLSTDLLPKASSVCFLIWPGTTCPGLDLLPVRWAFHINHWWRKMPPQTCRKAVYYRHLLSWGSSSQMTVACFKLTKKLTRTDLTTSCTTQKVQR